MAEALFGYLRQATVTMSDELRPFRAALAGLLPGWFEAGGDRADTGVDPLVVLGEGVLRLLRQFAGDRGCVLVLEDLHWADRDTLGLLEYLVPAIGDAPILAVVSSRSDERHPESLRRLAASPNVSPVTLRRLEPDQVARLVAACAGGAILPPAVVRLVTEVAEGLPFLWW